MFKKCICVLVLLMLCGCQSKEEEQPQSKAPSSASTLSDDIVYKNLFNGDGNEKGFYHLSSREVDNVAYTNIYYYDYETSEEIFLCNRPECTHTDESCPSYVKAALFESFLFTNGSHLYLIASPSVERGTGNKKTEIIQMGLDGSDHKRIAQLPTGYNMENSSIALAGTTLYLPMSKTDYKQMNDGVTLQLSTGKKIVSLNLENGDMKTVIDQKKFKKQDYTLIGGDDQRLVFMKLVYSQDPDELLQNNDYDTYDQVMMNAKRVYTTYDLKHDEFSSDVASISDVAGEYDNGFIYEVNNTSLVSLSLESGEHKELATLPDAGSQP